MKKVQFHKSVQENKATRSNGSTSFQKKERSFNDKATRGFGEVFRKLSTE